METRLFCFFNTTNFKLLKTRLPGLFMACALVLCGMGASAQAPRFTYSGPFIFTAGTTITAATFKPVFTTGSVPANAFGTVSTNTATGTVAPTGITSDGASNIYLIDQQSPADKLYKGTGASPTYTLVATLGVKQSVYGIAYSAHATALFVSESGQNKIVEFSTAGTQLNTFGTGTAGNNGTSSVAIASAKFNSPKGVAVDGSGNIYIADATNNQIRMINAALTTVSVVAGSGSSGHADGTGTSATFNAPTGIVIDPTNTWLYVSETGNNDIRRITIATGQVVLFAGSVTQTSGSADGITTAASFNAPQGLTVDASGNIYVTDTGNNKIRMVTPAGVVFTIAGNGTAGHVDSATGTTAEFKAPTGIVWDSNRADLFVADQLNAANGAREIIGTGFFIGPSLPAGYTFDATTGTIAGTPAAASGPVLYTVFGFNTNTASPGNSGFAQVSISTDVAAFSTSWKGGASGVWELPSNWTNGVPTANLTALIGTAATITINSAAIVNTINNTAAATLTISSGNSLTVTTKMLLSANLTIGGAGSVILQPIAVLNTGANTLTFNGTTAGAFILQSNATGSASVSQIPTGGSITGTGTFTVQRYLQGGIAAYRGYRLLSSPVNNGTIDGSNNKLFSLSYLNTGTGIPVTGPGGTTNGFTTDPNNRNNPSLFEWQENIPGTNATFFTSNFRPVSNLTTNTMPIGNGFLAFSRGELGETPSAFLTTTTPTAATLCATGALNQGSIQVHLWFQASASTFDYTPASPFPGYTLVGNPYASSIDWDTFQTGTSGTGIYSPSPSVMNTITVLDPVSHNYGVYQQGSGGVGTLNATNVIASGQGFFVRDAGLNMASSLQFNESAKISTQNEGFNLLESTSAPAPMVVQYLRLRLAADSVNTDETMLRFTNTATNLAYNKNTDATYLPGNGIESLASLSSDKVAVAIKALPLPGLQGQTIGLVVNASADGQYTLGLHDIVAVPQLYQVWLKDALAKDSLDLRSNAAYAFNITHADTNSFGSHRFSLVIRQNPALGLHLLSFAATKATTGALITWVTENEANYTNFTLQRSTDNGVSFTTIGGFASTSAGTYSFTDAKPLKPADEYRLQLTDINGTITYSAIVTLAYNNQNSTAANTIVIYPNPTKGLLNVSITQALGIAANQSVGITTPAAATGKVYGIKIMGITGFVVKTATTAQATWQTDISSLAPGTYIVQVVDSSNNNLIGKGQFIKL